MSLRFKPQGGRWSTFFIALVLCVASAPAAPAGRPFEVRDSIQIADFLEAPVLSPDGKHFVTVTQRGVLPQGVTEATLWLFDSAAVRRAVADGSPITPVPLARISGALNTGSGVLGSKGLMMNIRWTPDGSGVLFLARNGQDNRQLFRASLNALEPVSLSAATQDVVDFAVAGARVVYFAAPDASTVDLWNNVPPSAPDIVVGTGMRLGELLFPNGAKIQRNRPTVFEAWSVNGATAAPVKVASRGVPLTLIGSYNVSAMEVSPDGGRLVTIVHADEVPKSWQDYAFSHEPDTRPFLAHAASDKPEQDYGRALQYQVIDLDKGERHPLLDAPLADWQRGGKDALQAEWSTDGRYVAASGTYLPLDARNGKGTLSTCGVAVVDTRTGKYQCLVDGAMSNSAAVQQVSWVGAGLLRVRLGNAKVLHYEQRNGHWRPASKVELTAAAGAQRLELTVRQALNDPPSLFATDPTSGQERRIFDPNPQLADVAMGTVSVFTWTDEHGRTIEGGLVKPADFVVGKRYPLVVQTHNFRPRRFFRTGISDTASAGRALAARGMLVLQVDEPDDAYMFTPQEATENGTKVYLAAIDKLAAEGLVDPKRVGITGYSRTALYVAKAITDEPDRFAAAVVANGDPGSLLGYYGNLESTDQEQWTATFAGAQPYGDGLKQWIENAPGFRTERIRAPVLIAAGDPGHLLPLWGLYAPLRQQGKPVELQYIRGGQHNLVKPLEILAHQELLVDWFDFWLNGREDPDAGKLEQYRRWEGLRETGSRPAAR